MNWFPQSAALLVMQRHPVAEGVQRAPFAPYGAYFASGTGFVDSEMNCSIGTCF